MDDGQKAITKAHLVNKGELKISHSFGIKSRLMLIAKKDNSTVKITWHLGTNGIACAKF